MLSVSVAMHPRLTYSSLGGIGDHIKQSFEGERHAKLNPIGKEVTSAVSLIECTGVAGASASMEKHTSPRKENPFGGTGRQNFKFVCREALIGR
jgi:hypothetical protein|tara:strand:- start:93 stop:374 length:282 start_codon:yes stop_codon:yes gene_type:complete